MAGYWVVVSDTLRTIKRKGCAFCIVYLVGYFLDLALV